MSRIFKYSSFNDDRDSWDMSSVTTMQGMFSYATVFNQDIDSRGTSNATTIRGMVRTHVFNQDIDSWDT